MNKIDEIFYNLKKAWLKKDKKEIAYWQAKRDRLFHFVTKNKYKN